MEWFVKNVFADPSQTSDKRLNLVARDDLAGLPSATVILAEIDPLRSEGEAYANALSKAGVKVNQKTFPGATHEFFGMGKVVKSAADAMSVATTGLNLAFEAAKN